jgi:hypothetical protein
MARLWRGFTVPVRIVAAGRGAVKEKAARFFVDSAFSGPS